MVGVDYRDMDWEACGSLRICNTEIYMYEIPNHASVLADIPDKFVPANGSLVFQVNAVDPDGDSLVYSAQNLPPGASFNAGIHTFVWPRAPSKVTSYQTTL